MHIYHHSFFPSAVGIWNRLPVHLVTAISLEQFKTLINYNFTNVKLICLVVYTVCIGLLYLYVRNTLLQIYTVLTTIHMITLCTAMRRHVIKINFMS